jgi:hypothetical protein
MDPCTRKLICSLTRREAKSMEDQGTARRTGRNSYTMIRPVPPSDSELNMCALVRHDMHIVAGLSRGTPTEAEYERLEGWGFRPERKQLSRLDPQMAGVSG